MVPAANVPPRTGGRGTCAAVVRAAADIPLAAVLTVRSLPVDIRHASKIDRSRLARWADGVLAGARVSRRRERGVRVLVTGTTGMLGRGVALALAARGDHVTVLQRRPAGLGLPEVLADVADADAVRAAVAGHDAVVHLAAKVNVIGPEPEYLRVNVGGTQAVVDACRAAGVERLVHVSSPSVAHQAARSRPRRRSRRPGDRARTVRPKQGARGTGRARRRLRRARGRRHPAAPGVGPGGQAVDCADRRPCAAGRLPLIGSGAALIDTTYVTNAVDALVAALDRCLRRARAALVVTNGEPRPVAEMLAAVCGAAGVPVPTATPAGATCSSGWSGRRVVVGAAESSLAVGAVGR